MSTVTTSRRWQGDIRRTLAAELTKLWTLPAVWLTLGGTWAIHLLLSTAAASADRRNSTGSTQMALDSGLSPLIYTQAGFIILGVVAACSEYNGGQIRTTLAVTPRRTMQLLTATAARTVLAIPGGMIVAVSGVVVAQVAIGGTVDFDGLSAGQLIGVTSYLVLITLMSAAAGTMLRRTLPAVGIVMGYYFIVGPLLRDQSDAAKYLPDAAGLAMWLSAENNVDALTPVQGGLVMGAWTLAAITTAMLMHRHRDT